MSRKEPHRRVAGSFIGWMLPGDINRRTGRLERRTTRVTLTPSLEEASAGRLSGAGADRPLLSSPVGGAQDD